MKRYNYTLDDETVARLERIAARLDPARPNVSAAIRYAARVAEEQIDAPPQPARKRTPRVPK